MKIKLIQEFYRLYAYYWKTNCGLDVIAIQRLTQAQLEDRIADYKRLIQLRKI